MIQLEEKTSGKDLLFGKSVVIRLEEILAGNSFEKLLAISRNLSNTYINGFNSRLKNLYAGYDSLPETTLEDEENMYMQNLEFALSIAKIPYDDLTQEEILKLSELYSKSIDESFMGPPEFYKRGLNIEQKFNSLQDEIVKGMQARLPDILPLPQSFQILEKIEYLEDVVSRLKYYKTKALPLAINRNVLLNNFEEVKKILKQIKYKAAGRKIELVIDDDGNDVRTNDKNSRIPYHYNAHERKLLIKLEELVDEIWFSEFFKETQIPANRGELWTYFDVMEANFDVEYFVYLLKNMGLSPFEELILTNIHLSESNYTGMATSDEKTRTFLTAKEARSKVGRLNMLDNYEAYVCTGQASHAKVIFDEYGSKNIETTLIPTYSFSRKSGERRAMVAHSFLLMYLKDDKYGIDTYGVYDPTWSSDHLDFVMSPIEDFQNFERWIFSVNSKEYSNICKFLHTPDVINLKDGEVKNLIYEEFCDKSSPIPIETYIKALSTVIDKIKQTNFCTIYDFSSISTKDAVEALLTATIKDISFYKEDAKNPFFVAIKNFLKEHADEFPDYEHLWRDYIDNLQMDINGKISLEK